MSKDPVKINVPELEDILERYLTAAAGLNYAIKIVGHPGIGKSDVVRQMARKCGFLFIDTRLAFKENIDLGGYPVPDHDNRKMIYYRPRFIPPAVVPDEHNGIVWFLDEANRAHPTVIQTLFQIITEGVCGEHPLPEKTFIVLAGNLGDDDQTALTEFDDAALDGRLALFHLLPDAASWLSWAHAENIHPAVIRYITSFPDRLWDERQIHPNPRGWHQVSNALLLSYGIADEQTLTRYLTGDNGVSLGKVIQSLVGRVAAGDFILQITAPRQLSTAHVLNGDKQKRDDLQQNNIPAEDVLWALSGAVTHLREMRLKNETTGTAMNDRDKAVLANVLTFIGAARADMQLSFFYQLLARAAVFTHIPDALKTIEDSALAEDIATKFQELLEA